MVVLAVATVVGLSLFTTSALAAQPPVGLGTADSFGVLAGSAVTNTGPSTVNGDLGVTPGTAITGFPPGTVNGTTHADDAVARQAQSDLTTAYDDAAGRTPAAAVSADIGGQTLTAGVYKASSALGLTGRLTLDAQGDPHAVFIFQVGSSLTTASGSDVRLVNGAQACNVYWQIGSSATLGTASVFVGNLLALTSISLNDAVTVHGRALARNGAVTMINDTITIARCAEPVDGPPAAGAPAPAPAPGPAAPAPAPGPAAPAPAPAPAPGPAAPAPAPTSSPPASSPTNAAPADAAQADASPTAASPTAASPAASSPTAGSPTAGAPPAGATPAGSSTPTGATPGRGTAKITTPPSVAKKIRRYGTTRCVEGFRATVRGSFIRRVVFSIGGRVIASRGKAPFSASVGNGNGIRTLTARVTFTDGTRAVKLTMRFRSCSAAAARVTRNPSRTPRIPTGFTG